MDQGRKDWLTTGSPWLWATCTGTSGGLPCSRQLRSYRHQQSRLRYSFPPILKETEAFYFQACHYFMKHTSGKMFLGTLVSLSA